MKKTLTSTFLLLLSLYTAYPQGVPVPKIVKKDVIKAKHTKYDATYLSSGTAYLLDHSFNLPEIKNEDQILFDQESRNVRVDRSAVADAVARVMMKSRSKIKKSKFKPGMYIGMRFFVDNKTSKVLFTEFSIKHDQYNDLGFFRDLEDEFQSAQAGKLMRIIGNVIPRIKTYGYLTSSATVTYYMLKDKVEL
ncbi:hypothetical protein [Mucilaginibacter sp. PAMB04168]|uniref:hypothetical protein n=1 Tax=Mucilaginibacter sp. PAMB04168 TaxID=3138567 RepID=UPI0031F63207